MKLLKKALYLFFGINIIYYGYLIYKKGYKYDANDPDKSLVMMIKLTDPLERTTFLKKFQIACNDGRRCINLHGLTKKEIYEVARKREEGLK